MLPSCLPPLHTPCLHTDCDEETAQDAHPWHTLGRSQAGTARRSMPCNARCAHHCQCQPEKGVSNPPCLKVLVEWLASQIAHIGPVSSRDDSKSVNRRVACAAHAALQEGCQGYVT